MNEQKLEGWTFEELRQYCMTQLVNGLINGGFKGMNLELWDVMTTSMNWRELQIRKEKEESKKTKGKR